MWWWVISPFCTLILIFFWLWCFVSRLFIYLLSNDKFEFFFDPLLLTLSYVVGMMISPSFLFNWNCIILLQFYNCIFCCCVYSWVGRWRLETWRTRSLQRRWVRSTPAWHRSHSPAPSTNYLQSRSSHLSVLVRLYIIGVHLGSLYIGAATLWG